MAESESSSESTALVASNSARSLPARLRIRSDPNKIIVLPPKSQQNGQPTLPAIPHSKQQDDTSSKSDNRILKLWMPASYFEDNVDAWPSSLHNDSSSESRSNSAGRAVTRSITQFACLVKEIRPIS
jgi:hypothetical protein